MENILGFVEKLNEVDTKNVEPLIFLNEEPQELREDKATKTVSTSEALQNAPDHNDQYFKVPKVIEKPQ